ncbi:MAG: ATP-binding protein [Mucinivorans sp.]
MENQYQDLCKVLRAGLWSVNLKSRRVTIDSNLSDLLQTHSTEFDFNDFLNSISSDLQRAEVQRVVGLWPAIESTDYHVQLTLHEIKYFFEVIITSDSNSDKVSGFMRIENTEPDPVRSSVVLSRHSASLLNKIYRSMPVGIELYDQDGILVDINQKAMEIFGIDSPEQVIGLNLFESNNAPDEFKKQLRQGEQFEAFLKYDFESERLQYHSTRSGVRDIRVKCMPMHDERNKVSHYLLIYIDDTEKVQAYNEVQDLKNLFSVVIGFANIGYCKWDMLSQKGFAIDHWYANIGETTDTPIGYIISHFDHVCPNDRGHLLDAFQKIRSGQLRSIRQELKVCHGDSYKWVYHNVVVTKYEPENNSIEVVAVNVEISHHKETELKLIEANEHSSVLAAQRDLVMNNLSSALLYVDSNYIVQWESSKVVASIYGVNCFVPNKVCYHTAYGLDEPCEDCPLTKMLHSRMCESSQITPNNKVVEIVANPVFDNAGNLLGGVVRIEDITRRRQNERRIDELNTLMQAILDNIPVYVFVKDPNNEFRYLYWNKAIADHLNISSEDAIGRTDAQILPSAAEADYFYKSDLSILKHGKPVELDESFHGADGVRHITRSLKTLIPSKGDKLPLVMGVSWDITEFINKEAELLEAKEKAEQSDKFKTSFLANISHEIRTPLNAIIGFSDLLLEEDTSIEERKEYLTIIHKNNKLLLQLISDILDLSRIEAHVLEFNYAPLNIHLLCSRIATSCSMRDDANVPVLFDETLPEYILTGDENRIHQVITNFVTNAIKFTEHGSIQISYKLISQQTQLEISVQDTGIGIQPGLTQTIFDRFTKLNSFIQGTGLGLSICKTLVEQFGGQIGVDSEYGVGSRFWFTIPYDK